MTEVEADKRRAARLALPTLVTTVLVCWIALLWPAIANRGPLLFVDTTAYVRGADAGFGALFGVTTAWSVPKAESSPDLVDADPSASADAEPRMSDDRITLAGRSVYYGVLPYLSYLLTWGFGLAILAQALLVAVAVCMTVFRFGVVSAGSPAAFLLPPIVLLGTSAPYFATFVMPDIFMALSILAIANIVVFWSRDRIRMRTFWTLLLIYAALSHSATLLLIIATASIGLVLGAAGYIRIPRAASGALAAAILTGIAGEIVFSIAVQGITGQAPVRPPFLTARIVDDGPGYRYLRESCPQNGFILCRLIDRPPVNSDVFLWSPERGKGAFLSGSPHEARRLAAEQGRFVLAVLQSRPVELLRSSLGAIGRQAGMIKLSEFHYDEGTREHLRRKLPAADQERASRSPAYLGRLPTRFVGRLVLPLSLASLAIIAVACTRTRQPGRALSRATLFALTILAGIVLNVVISGAISTPHDRYNMRALWLLPILALALLPMLKRSSTR